MPGEGVTGRVAQDYASRPSCPCAPQILLVSSQISLLTATTEVVVRRRCGPPSVALMPLIAPLPFSSLHPACQTALIYPFRWCHTVIPVLPRGLMEVLQSPMPFILGMHLDQWREALDEVPEWVVQVRRACGRRCSTLRNCTYPSLCR